MIDRYSRQTIFPGIGEEGQQKLGSNCVVIIGYGALGTILDQAFDIKVRTGLHCAPAAHKTLGTFPLGTIRLSPGYFNTREEIDFTVEAIKKFAVAEALTTVSSTALEN